MATAVTLLLTAANVWTWLATLSTEAETGHGSHRGHVARVVLDVDQGDLVLVPGEPGRVDFERRLEWTGSRPTVEESWDGQTFRVTARCVGPAFLPRTECTVGYTIRVPPGAAVDEVTVEATTGNPTIEVPGG